MTDGQPCECGCGELVTRDPRGRQSRFVYGHSGRKYATPEEAAAARKAVNLAATRKYRSLHADRQRESQKRWKKSHLEQHREAARLRRERDRDKRRAASRKWLKDNPEKHREIQRRRRARKAGALAARYKESEILDRDGWRCQLCGKRIVRHLRHPDPLSASIDHIIPISQGGTDEPANVQAAHYLCNIKKGARTLPTGEQTRLP